MSEEEIINKVDKFIYTVTVILPNYSTKIPEYCIDEEAWIAIKGLLDLYNKEKEKNKKAQNKLQKYNKRGQTLAHYMEDKTSYMYKAISKNWIEKNKIKEIIKLTTQNKEIVKLPNNETICVSDCYELLNYLQELLEERN